jgi:hypothetical protein
MSTEIHLDAVYAPTQDIVAREIEGEIIIIPLTAAIAGPGEESNVLFTLNKTGRAVWKGLDGRRSLRTLVDELAGRFDAPRSEIEADTLGLVEELARRLILVRVPE